MAAKAERLRLRRHAQSAAQIVSRATIGSAILSSRPTTTFSYDHGRMISLHRREMSLLFRRCPPPATLLALIPHSRASSRCGSRVVHVQK